MSVDLIRNKKTMESAIENSHERWTLAKSSVSLFLSCRREQFFFSDEFLARTGVAVIMYPFLLPVVYREWKGWYSVATFCMDGIQF